MLNHVLNDVLLDPNSPKVLDLNVQHNGIEFRPKTWLSHFPSTNPGKVQKLVRLKWCRITGEPGLNIYWTFEDEVKSCGTTWNHLSRLADDHVKGKTFVAVICAIRHKEHLMITSYSSF